MICKSCGGDKKHHAHGLCTRCYHKWRYSTNQCNLKKITSVCKVCGEIRICRSREMCIKCYMRWKRGSIDIQGIPTPNKKCATYLGVNVAEKVLSMVFKDISVMPVNNHGYDFICNKGKKIDVKSACIDNSKHLKCRWSFIINKNKTADYFLCLAFDNRADLTPLHMWLIPAEKVNNFVKVSISESTLQKWIKYKIDKSKTIKCCNSIKFA